MSAENCAAIIIAIQSLITNYYLLWTFEQNYKWGRDKHLITTVYIELLSYFEKKLDKHATCI